jgi:hypothetical protein
MIVESGADSGEGDALDSSDMFWLFLACPVLRAVDRIAQPLKRPELQESDLHESFVEQVRHDLCSRAHLEDFGEDVKGVAKDAVDTQFRLPWLPLAGLGATGAKLHL